MPLQELSSVLMAMDGVREPQTDTPSASSAPSDAPQRHNKPTLIQRSNTGEGAPHTHFSFSPPGFLTFKEEKKHTKTFLKNELNIKFIASNVSKTD